MKLHRILLIFYFVLSICFILLEYRYNGWISVIIKACIIPLLAGYFILRLEGVFQRTHQLLFAGLFFSWVGDVLLQINNLSGGFFIPGLLSFLVTQVFYTLAFLQGGRIAGRIKRNSLPALMLLIYGMILVGVLYPGLDSMLLPVSLYALVICLMAIAAITRRGTVANMNYHLTAIGAFLFLISDSLIAISKFAYPFVHSGLAVLSTYFLAQFFIVQGTTVRINNVSI